MINVHTSSLPTGTLKTMILALLFVISSSVVADAGVMIAPLENPSEMVVDASLVIPPQSENEPHHGVETSNQEYGMSLSSSGGSGATFPVLIGVEEYPTTQPTLVQWLVFRSRTLVPSPIPICLLKVPIVIA